ncbi:MvaI/BcnI restriction endonuclease family protein [Granulosicoccus sp.]|nr:MvaI/BcnI family restriction endonuclease [Granulosicoccus sp.]MDB4223946.1 MvaI/BcnI restriction endonuclease family protein [Granulosicoccus sp.]
MTVDQGTFDTTASRELSLSGVIKILQDKGVSDIYVKKLAPNDNSKNQPYFGSHLVDLPFIPTGEIVASASASNKTKNPKRKIKYQASLDLSWVDAEGNSYKAPHAKLIYYPQYPEVRFSGFLLGSKVRASKWMAPEKQGRSEGRWLILGTDKESGSIYAYLVTPESNLSKELASTQFIELSTIFWQLNTRHLVIKKPSRDLLIDKLLEIHQEGWIQGEKLNATGKPEYYGKPNAGGYTLESRLGISPNGIAEPDYLGWEVKQFGVTKFPKTGTRPTTLMTPEPNGGYYTIKGAAQFVKTYGYADKSGIADRMNFGGKHLVGQRQNLTNLTMKLIGFDAATSSITDASGVIALLDSAGNVTASWSFAKFMDHWKRKHSKAVYIPCMKRMQLGRREYYFGKDVELGTGTSFEMILSAMNLGAVYYDPGIKLEHVSSAKPALKRRNQFRVNHKHLETLYKKYEILDVASMPEEPDN